MTPNKIEYEVKAAYKQVDAGSVLPNKADMWLRIESQMSFHHKVSPLWRIAAVFVGLMLIASVYAGFSVVEWKKSKLENIQTENLKLKETIDSLTKNRNQSKPKSIAEKIIYRDRIVHTQIGTNEWENKYQQLKDSAETEIAKLKRDYTRELEQIESQQTLGTANTPNNTIEAQYPQSHQIEPFQLKQNQLNLKTSPTANPHKKEVEIKFLDKKLVQESNELNITLFKSKQ